MNTFKLTLASALVAHAIASYSVAADYTVSADGVISSDMTFSGSDKLFADQANSFGSDTTTTFTDNFTLNAQIKEAISAGRQVFNGSSSLNVEAQDAITGGVQEFRGSSSLKLLAVNAISGGRQNFYDQSSVTLKDVGLDSDKIAFNLAGKDTSFTLNGQEAVLGSLEGSGRVVNDSDYHGKLTINTGKLGSSTFDGVLADGGKLGKLSLTKDGAGEWIFNGDGSGMTGTTTVSKGQLTVNGDLSNSDVTVFADGVLAGNGSVGAVDLKTFAVLGTENVTDRLKINGDLTFSQTSTLFLKAGPDGRAGLIDAQGTARLNFSTVYVEAGAGNYTPNTRYTILTAAGGVVGTFRSTSSTLYFLTPKLIYNTHSVELELERNDKLLVSAANSPSAINVAANLDKHSLELVNRLLTSDLDTAGSALEQLAGAASASRVSAMLASNAQVSSSMLQAMEQRDSRGNSLQMALLDSDGPLLVSSDVPSAARNLRDPNAEGRVWVKALGSQGNFESGDNAGDLQQRTHGGLVGADWSLGDAWRLGIVSGYSKTTLDANTYLNGAVNSYHLGAYAWRHNGALATRMGIVYSGHDGTSKRHVDFNEFRDTPRASCVNPPGCSAQRAG